MKPLLFPRVIQLDKSDERIYPLAAQAGEWAVTGSFHFHNIDPATLSGKQKQAFAHGFLGTNSFGWTTLVSIGEITQQELDAVIQSLAKHLVSQFGAPDIATAIPVAREETEFAMSLCEHDTNTLLTIERDYSEEGIEEMFKVVKPNAGDHAKIKLWGPDTDA